MRYLHRLTCDECRDWSDAEWQRSDHVHLYILQPDEVPAVISEYKRGLMGGERLDCLVARTRQSRVHFVIQARQAPPLTGLVVSRMSVTAEMFRYEDAERVIWQSVLHSAISDRPDLPPMRV